MVEFGEVHLVLCSSRRAEEKSIHSKTKRKTKMLQRSHRAPGTQRQRQNTHGPRETGAGAGVLPNFEPSGLLEPKGYESPRDAARGCDIFSTARARGLSVVCFRKKQGRNSFKLFDAAEHRATGEAYRVQHSRDRKTWYSFGVRSGPHAGAPGTARGHVDFDLATGADSAKNSALLALAAGAEGAMVLFIVQLQNNNKFYLFKPNSAKAAVLMMNGQVVPEQTYIELRNSDIIEMHAAPDVNGETGMELEYIET